jgi:hypothetical protein
VDFCVLQRNGGRYILTHYYAEDSRSARNGIIPVSENSNDSAAVASPSVSIAGIGDIDCSIGKSRESGCAKQQQGYGVQGTAYGEKPFMPYPDKNIYILFHVPFHVPVYVYILRQRYNAFFRKTK